MPLCGVWLMRLASVPEGNWWGGVHYNKHTRRRQKWGLLGLQPGEEGQDAAARYSLLGTKAQAAWKPDYRHRG